MINDGSTDSLKQFPAVQQAVRNIPKLWIPLRIEENRIGTFNIKNGSTSFFLNSKMLHYTTCKNKNPKAGIENIVDVININI